MWAEAIRDNGFEERRRIWEGRGVGGRSRSDGRRSGVEVPKTSTKRGESGDAVNDGEGKRAWMRASEKKERYETSGRLQREMKEV